MREDINAGYKSPNSKLEIIKLALHYVSKVLLWSVFLILIILAITLIVYVVDLKKNIETGKNTIPLFNAYVIISPSMVPAIKVQDAVVVMRTDPEYLKKNDIITFDSKDPRYSGITITHRIVGIENRGTDNILFRTKGDNNNAEDSSLVNGKDIYGKVILRLPKIGYIQFFLSQTYGWIIAIVIPCLAIIIYDIIKLIKTIRNEASNIKNIRKNANNNIPKTISGEDFSNKNKKNNDMFDDEILGEKKKNLKNNHNKIHNDNNSKKSKKNNDKNKHSSNKNAKRSIDDEEKYLELLKKYNEKKRHKKGGR